MFKRIVFSLFMMMCLAVSTEIHAQKTEPTVGGTPNVGGTKDEHGCYVAAGYSWSVLKNECIQIFNSGIRLDVKLKKLDQTTSAFAVFKKDAGDAKVEVFIPFEKKSIILNRVAKSASGKWKNAMYTLTENKGIYSLENKKKVLLYQGAAVK